MKSFTYKAARTPMLLRISAGFFLGMLLGFVAAPILPYSSILSDYVLPFMNMTGKLFLLVLNIIMVPLVFSSIASGITSIGDTRKLGRIGAKTLLFFLITTVIAAFIGLCSANIFKAGINIDIPHGLNAYSGEFMPENYELFSGKAISSFVNANMLKIIIASVMIGSACLLLGRAGEKAAGLLNRTAKFMYVITLWVMEAAPFGVFALIFTGAIDFGLTLVAPFVKIIAAVFAGCFVHVAVVYSLIVVVFCRRSPLWFFKCTHEAVLTAFVSRSSLSVLPVTFEVVRERLGVSDEISSFVLPLGATVNMNGTAIYYIVCALFVARAFNIPITFELVSVVLSASILGSVSAAAVPGGGLVMLAMVLSSAGLPVEGIGIIAGIDVILSSARTSVNVLGDAAVCAAVAVSEGEALNDGRFDAKVAA